MKANRRTWILLLLVLVATAFQLPAQQTEADRELFTEVKSKAEKGDAKAQDALGDFFTFGKHGVTKDPVEGVKWYRKAAEQGFGHAQYNLGISYEKGHGVTQDFVEAVRWFRKAAEEGNALPQYSLGVCYANGKGVTQDFLEAVKWYRKAANQGYDEAQLSLGACCEAGDGVPKDFVEAAKWYQKAANQGCAGAQFLLGGCYFLGKGVTTDANVPVIVERRLVERFITRLSSRVQVGNAFEGRF